VRIDEELMEIWLDEVCDTIKFSLSNADKGVVGLILALELASLTSPLKSIGELLRL